MRKNALAAILFRSATLLAPIGLIGCAGGPPQQELTLESAEHHQTYIQRFSNAYLSREGDGDVDIVLIDRATQKRLDGKPDNAPTRQVMHMRVLWNPKRDQKTDHNTASNATVHWYVMGNTPASEADVLEYEGTAFVSIDDSSPAELSVRNATVHPVACRGELCDPVGPSVIYGTIHARQDGRRVRDVLAAVRTVVAAASGMPTHLSSTAKPESPSSLAR
jgi:hypothetical protein